MGGVNYGINRMDEALQPTPEDNVLERGRKEMLHFPISLYQKSKVKWLCFVKNKIENFKQNIKDTKLLKVSNKKTS